MIHLCSKNGPNRVKNGSNRDTHQFGGLHMIVFQIVHMSQRKTLAKYVPDQLYQKQFCFKEAGFKFKLLEYLQKNDLHYFFLSFFLSFFFLSSFLSSLFLPHNLIYFPLLCLSFFLFYIFCSSILALFIYFLLPFFPFSVLL